MRCSRCTRPRTARNGSYAYSLCSVCKRAQRRSQPDYRAKRQAQKAARIERAQLFVLGYLLSHPCIGCRESNPLLLTFDHVRSKKRANIAQLIANGSSPDNLKREMGKCVIRCHNCHALRTSKQQRWGKVYLYQDHLKRIHGQAPR
jgi:hypothetical protein